MVSGVLGNWISKSKGFGVWRHKVKSSRYRLALLHGGKTISNQYKDANKSLFAGDGCQ